MRDIVIFTGQKGAELIKEAIDHEAIAKVYKAQLTFLKRNKRLDKETAKNLTTMIDSPDKDNRLMACMIIDNFDNDEYSI